MLHSTSVIHGEMGWEEEGTLGPIRGRFWIHLGFSLKKEREKGEGDSVAGTPTYMAIRGAEDTKEGMKRQNSNLSSHSCSQLWGGLD